LLDLDIASNKFSGKVKSGLLENRASSNKISINATMWMLQLCEF